MKRGENNDGRGKEHVGPSFTGHKEGSYIATPLLLLARLSIKEEV